MNQKSKLSLAVAAALGTTSYSSQAALSYDAEIPFNPGVRTCVLGGTPPDSCTYNVTTVVGSYFSMDTNADGTVTGNEKTPLTQHDGILLGIVQLASGSHTGSPNGSESPGIDQPWAFFTNTGMHQTISPITILSDDGAGNATLDMSGWNVTWNGIYTIQMGGDPANFDPSMNTGIATMTCAATCTEGDTYVLEYSAHVPKNDKSGFGGVRYKLHLEGTIGPGSPPVPTRSVAIQVTGGNLHECSSHDGSVIEVTADVDTNDISDIATINWTIDGAPVGSGASLNVLSPLGTHTVGVVLDTVSSGIFQSSSEVTVMDNVSPELSMRFVDQKSGLEITEVSNKGKQFVNVIYDVVDVCDVEPTVNGVATQVNAVDAGSTMEIIRGQLVSSVINVSATATDASGNEKRAEARLPIVD